MAGVRYHIVTEIPPEARSAEFVTLADNQVRVRVMLRGDEIVIVAHGSDPAACEALLRRLGATDIGLDLCG